MNRSPEENKVVANLGTYRCARNCFNCPICTAPLAVNTLENVTGNGTQQGPWVLSCGYCMWTTLDIGIKFDKPTNIRTQLSKMTDPAARSRQMSKSFGELKSPLSTYSSIDEQFSAAAEDGGRGTPTGEQPSEPLGPDARFAALKGFYRNQIAETTTSPNDPLGTDFGGGFSSPGALNRIMSLYTSSSRLNSLYGGASKKPKSKPPVMREALTASEGLKVPAADAEDAVIQRMASEECGWDDVASIEQRAFQSPDARFTEDLLPLPVLLRTKRSKRCKSCKHILVKPEFKPQSTRFRIRLIALSYIPLTTLRPLAPAPPQPGLPASPTTTTPNLDSLPPLKPVQLLLTLKNHMFDPVRVTLATPSVTPGRVATKVTILCPQLDVGANSDVWDEALQGSAPGDQRSSRSGALSAGYEKVAEAGKVWDKGRNWTTVVIEVVPGVLPGGGKSGSATTKQDNKDSDDDSDSDDNNNAANLDWSGQSKDQNSNANANAQLQPDEDVLEIPIFVRMEWDSENQIEQSVGKGQGSDTVKRELAYWMVLGVGRIAPELG